jgi:hypothetical protein
VTDGSGPPGELAQQVAELHSIVERYQAIVTAWDARLEREGIGGTLMLRLEVKRLAQRLDGALDKRRLAPPPAPWWCVSEAEGRKLLAELRSWVDEFARKHYPAYLARVPACWANHPEAVWELSTLRAEWERVYGDEDNRDLAGALWWHERWLPGTIGRLEKAITCDQAGCRRVVKAPW